MTSPDVLISEVGPRDGLQSVSTPAAGRTKGAFYADGRAPASIQLLAASVGAAS